MVHLLQEKLAPLLAELARSSIGRIENNSTELRKNRKAESLRNTCFVAAFYFIVYGALVIINCNRVSGKLENMTTTSSVIISEIDTFVSNQNVNRSGVTPLDYNALTGTVPTGGNSVTGISGIASGAATIALPSSGIGNTVIVDGGISTTASSSGADSYSLAAGADGTLTLTDNNTGFSQSFTGASEFVFDLAATTSGGNYQSFYIVATGNAAVVASMYGAALERAPDFAGLDFYVSRLGSSVEPDLHMAATYILNSPEEQKLYPAAKTTPDQGGPNDTSFVTDLYSGILHRIATAAEIAFYDNALAGALTNSSGQTLAAVDRATVLEYFAASHENQADIAGSNGGWLINPAKGAVNFGALTQASGNAVLSSDISSGTISANDFATMSSSGSATYSTAAGSVAIHGVDYGGTGATQEGAPDVVVYIPNLTLILTAQYYEAFIGSANVTVNGVSSGGSVVIISNQASIVTATGSTFPAAAGSGTINFSGDGNWIGLRGYGAVSAPTIVHGWNSTDVLVGNGATPGTQTPAASLLATSDVTVYQGNLSTPVSGATLGAQNSGTWFANHSIAINVGQLADDSVATMVTAANRVYQVADTGTPNGFNSETVMFFGQDAQGNTMVDFWHGDTTKSHTISAVDITGEVQLVGVQASSLTSANFHH